MEAQSASFTFSTWSVIAIILGLLIAYTTFLLVSRANTMPNLQGFRNNNVVKEGFGAPVVGAGEPNCLHESNDAAAVLAAFTGRVGSVEEGTPDLEELRVLLGKLCCFKRDLIGVISRVNATLYQPFVTAHDIEPVAETTGRCFAKTIPGRDLELSFEKWKVRGRFLIQRLCAAANMDTRESVVVNDKFNSVLVDVYDIAQQKCLGEARDMTAVANGRETGAFAPPEIKDLGEYKGYY